MRIDTILKVPVLGQVIRYHSEGPAPIPQGIGCHSWGMMALAFLLIDHPSVDLCRAITFHDGGEHGPGDVPYTAKQRWPELNTFLKIAEEETRIELGIDFRVAAHDARLLSFLDMLECALWSRYMTDEFSSKRFRRYFQNAMKALRSRGLPQGLKQEAGLLIDQLYKEAFE